MSIESHEDIVSRNQRIAQLLPSKTEDGVWLQIKNLHMQNMLDYVEDQQNFHAALHEYQLWQENQPIDYIIEPDEADINGALFACGSYVQLGTYSQENYQNCIELASDMILETEHQLGVVPLFYMMRGDAYQWLKKYTLSADDYLKALALNNLVLAQYDEVSTERTMIELSNAALYRRIFDNYVLQGEIETAQEIAHEFHQHVRGHEQRNILAHMYLDLGHDYHRLSHEKRQEDHVEPTFTILRKALEVFNENDDDALCALTHQHLGSIMMCAGKTSEGKKYFENALALHEVAHDEQWGPTTMCLAMYHRERGETGEFEKLFNIAEERYENYSSNELYAEFLHEKAAYYWMQGELDKASHYYNRSQDIYDFLIDPMSMDLRPHEESCENCKHSSELVDYFNKLQLERLEFKDLEL